VQYVTEQPKKTVVILMPRHKLGDEQSELLRQEHPDDSYNAAVWRGRHAWNPHVGNGREQKMCRRAEEAEEVEKAILDVETTLCKRGRGDKAVKCPFYDACAYQQQKRIDANIWFAAHECAVHEMQKAFGDVGWVIYDESPLDAFMFGIDINNKITLELDALCIPLPVDDEDKFGVGGYAYLMQKREHLYRELDKLRLPIEFYQGAAAPRGSLVLDDHCCLAGSTVAGDARSQRNLTWRGKVDPHIRPDTPREQLKTKLLEAAGNSQIKKEVTLWELVEAAFTDNPDQLYGPLAPHTDGNDQLYGRIAIHRGKEGRIIRMVGVKPLATGW